MTNPASNKKQLPAFLVLTIIAVIAAVALAVTNQVTRGPIAENAAKARREAFSAVLAADSYDELAVPADSGVSSLVVANGFFRSFRSVREVLSTPLESTITIFSGFAPRAI